MGDSVAFYVPLSEYPHASREPAAPQFVCEERWRIGNDVENLGLQLRAILNLRDEVLDELIRELDRFPNRHAEANEVFGFMVVVALKIAVARADTLRTGNGVAAAVGGTSGRIDTGGRNRAKASSL